MEAPDHQDLMGSHSSSSTGECPYPTAATTSLKRKRTKRHRALLSPPLPTTAASSSTSSVDLSATTEEEEDMAHCLILLAQGRALDSPAREKFTSRKFTETATTAGGKAGFYVYECKTCNKCFPSFQALGGHRASHKKPKMAATMAAATAATGGAATDQEKKQYFDDQESAENIVSINNINAFSLNNIAPLSQPAATSPTAHKQLRIHECSICGAEFSSGQALGGHMRRHRPIGAPPPESQQQQHQNNHQQEAVIIKKERNVLSLDLNLPAPSDENTITELPPPPPQTVAFPFPDKRPMVFSPTSALVDCHI